MSDQKVMQEVQKGWDFLKQPKVYNTIVVIALILFVILGVWIRVQGMDNLKDVTTDEYLPLALDPFYFLRVAETMLAEGPMPEVDSFRYPSQQIGFAGEILPNTVVILYKIMQTFDSEITLKYVHVISPVIFFVVGIFAFAWLVFLLTKSKSAALIASGLLAVIPSYLYRTMAGFADHESIGIMFFFLAMACFVYGLRFLDSNKEHKKSKQKSIIISLIAGLFTALTITSWGGVATFIFMIFPLAFLLLWLVKVKNLDSPNQRLIEMIIFYITWLISSLIISMFIGYSLSSLIARFITSNYSLLASFALVFILIDYGLISYLKKNNFLGKKEKWRIVYSVGATAFLGLIFFILSGESLIQLLKSVWDSVLHPFGSGRVGLTIAENKQPYLSDWISQTGPRLFWIFYAGLIFIGKELTKGFKKNQSRIILFITWVIMISGILFSRISADSAVLNGTSVLSQLILFGSIAVFLFFLIKIYFEDKMKVGAELLMIFSWLIFMLIAARSAVRTFFTITPFVCFVVAYLLIKLVNYAKKNKDETMKIVWIGVAIVLGALVLYSGATFAKASAIQAEYTSPSATEQWQKAMSWIRNNTEDGSIFVHWWDYGYWVQSLGERATVTDGGHAVGFWDHLIGRYVLTTPYPETALSFMKTHNVTNLLIDPTDLGKYTAYSSIGDGVNESENDRYGGIPILLNDASQTVETSNETLLVYTGGAYVDEDIIYELNGKEVFLPTNKAILGAIILTTISESGLTVLEKLEGIYVYNGNQYRLPIRYIYTNGRLIDTGEGVEAVVQIIPMLSSSTNGGVQITKLGAALYLSPKIQEGLFAQLYLMDDPNDEYSTITLAHSEDDPVVEILKLQGATDSDFVYYGDFRGPIKIWDVSYPSNIVTNEEFLRTSGEYAEFDNLKFTA